MPRCHLWQNTGKKLQLGLVTMKLSNFLFTLFLLKNQYQSSVTDVYCTVSVD